MASAKPLSHFPPLSSRDMVLHEHRQTIPVGFTRVGAAPDDHHLQLRIGITPNNIAGLERRLMAASDPSSKDYGRWLSKEEVESYVKPTASSRAAVEAYLASAHVNAVPISPAGDVLAVNMTVAQANALFSTQFTTFNQTKTGKLTIRTLSYSIPSALSNILDFVHPTTTFPEAVQSLPLASIPLPKGLINTTVSTLTAGVSAMECEMGIVTPACLQTMYGIPGEPARHNSSQIAVSGFLDQYANKKDLKEFLGFMRPDIPSSTTFTVKTIDSGRNDQFIFNAGTEANLDIQYTVGVATQVPVTFISVGENTKDGLSGFLDLASYLLAQETIPHSFTTSYGSDETDISPGIARNLCNAYMQLSARGTSVFFSSGDGGVSGSQIGQCPDGNFVPTFPSGCPWITSVGATTNVNETAADFSSGGFSNIFPRPSYQDQAVSSYLSQIGDMYRGRYNASGRAFPDISAVGNNIQIIDMRMPSLVAGTSASSPIIASIIALLNDELVSRNRPPLGFLNPFLYSEAGQKALKDVTTGSNPGCGTQGFPAKSSYDPVTGLGTPMYSALRTALGLH